MELLRDDLWEDYVKQGYRSRIGISTIYHNEVKDWNNKIHYCKTIFSAFALFCKINKIPKSQI